MVVVIAESLGVERIETCLSREQSFIEAKFNSLPGQMNLNSMHEVGHKAVLLPTLCIKAS